MDNLSPFALVFAASVVVTYFVKRHLNSRED